MNEASHGELTFGTCEIGNFFFVVYIFLADFVNLINNILVLLFQRILVIKAAKQNGRNYAHNNGQVSCTIFHKGFGKQMFSGTFIKKGNGIFEKLFRIG